MKLLPLWVIVFLSFFGLSNALYIAQNETAGVPLICNVQNLSGCNTVAASGYAHLFGFSLAWYGAFFFMLVFLAAALGLVMRHIRIARAIQVLSVFGVAASAYLTFVELYILHAVCIYCVASALIALLIFVFASFLGRRTVSSLV